LYPDFTEWCHAAAADVEVAKENDTIIATSDRIEGREILETLGLVRGNAVRARGIGYDFVAQVRNIFGGSIPEYTNLISQSRDEANDRMVEAARQAGADAIVGVRYTTSMIAAGMSEILAYGTAVKLR
jgi:uncharacterized protein YbjQ (UPF0145 family)